MMDNYQREYAVTVMGNSGVGKSAIMHKYIEDYFVSE
jgi:GTPase SAR1 family protein